MSNYNSLKTTIDANIKQNRNQEITGKILNSVLNQMVTTLGVGYQFAGVATIDTNPENSDAKVFYIANGKGTYTNFGGVSVTEDDVVVLYWDSSWHKVSTGIASQAKVTELEGDVANKQDINNTERVRFFQFSDFSEEGYINKSGELTQHAKYRSTDFIQANPGGIIKYNDLRAVSGYPLIALYDKEKPVYKSLYLKAKLRLEVFIASSICLPIFNKLSLNSSLGILFFKQLVILVTP